jgi:hypothetical protein
VIKMKESYVAYITDKIYLFSKKRYSFKFLKEIGAKKASFFSSKWEIEFKNEEEKAKIFKLLRDSDFAFSIGKEWSPAEQFEELREHGLLDGSYRQILWKKKNDYQIKENC